MSRSGISSPDEFLVVLGLSFDCGFANFSLNDRFITSATD